MINQSPGNNLVLYTLCDRSVFQRKTIVDFGTSIHDDEVVTTLTMMMNLCKCYTDIDRVKMIIAIEVHHKESKSIAMVFNSMQ